MQVEIGGAIHNKNKYKNRSYLFYCEGWNWNRIGL